MKKVFIILLILMLGISIIGCGKNDKEVYLEWSKEAESIINDLKIANQDVTYNVVLPFIGVMERGEYLSSDMELEMMTRRERLNDVFYRIVVFNDAYKNNNELKSVTAEIVRIGVEIEEALNQIKEGIDNGKPTEEIKNVFMLKQVGFSLKFNLLGGKIILVGAEYDVMPF